MDRRIAREILRLMERHESFVHATVVKSLGSVPGKVGASMIVHSDGSSVGTVGGAALEEKVKEHAQTAFKLCRSDLYHFDLQAWKPGGVPSLCGGSVDIAVEFVAARPHVLLWGGGHVTKAITEILPTLEYDFTVADDRPDWVTAERFPAAEKTLVAAPEALFDSIDPGVYTHLYLLGYDAIKDIEVLHRALERFPNFIGVIASASKREHMWAELRRRGVAADALSRIHCPIGLSIGAESPAEIAVSVVAELVAAQHGIPVVRPKSPSRHEIAEVEHARGSDG